MTINSGYRKPITILLVALAVAVWGTVMIRFSGYISVNTIDNNTSNQFSTARPSTMLAASPIPFLGNYPDPFRPTPIDVPEVHAAISGPDSSPSLEVQYAYRLKGIIGKTALLLTDIDPTLNYAAEGDSLPGLVVLSIQKDSVVVKQGEDTVTLRVDLQ